MTARYRRDVAAAGGRMGLFFTLLASASAHVARCRTCSRATRENVVDDAVVTDGVHLMARDLRQLHAFAARLGLRREWFQMPGLNIARRSSPHYDLTTATAFHRACALGALYVPARTFSEQTRSWFDARSETNGDQ